MYGSVCDRVYVSKILALNYSQRCHSRALNEQAIYKDVTACASRLSRKCEQQHAEGSTPSHTILLVTNVWKLIVKNDSEEFGLFNNRDESTIERKFWIWMSTAKSVEMHTHCFAA